MTRVLVVEDETRVAAAVRRGLVAEGYAVDVAIDGDEGLWYASENQYDVMVFDVMLPGRSGYDLCKALRDLGNWTPILMLTARSSELDEVEALDSGADDFLAKPFSYVVLVARLRALLRRGVRDRPVVLVNNGLALDPAGHRITRCGVEIVLTAREFAVLEFLMRHHGQVVSKRDILGSVWDFEFEGNPNIVEVYLRRIRQKIDEPFGTSTIQTIRGVGYRIERDGE